MPLHLPNGKKLALDRPAIMGILNVTPDSFSDGGQYADIDAAVSHALELIEQGADIIDVGGESTRPGSLPVSSKHQTERVVPVIKEILQHNENAVVSVDTTRADVAEAALTAGAAILNDVSAGRDDTQMLRLAARSNAPIVLMHMQGTPATMQDNPHYDDVVEEVRSFLMERADAAMAESVRRDQIIIDPGIGFGKRFPHNLQLLANLDRLVATGFPLLLGTSRKGFIGEIHRDSENRPIAATERVGGTCATTTLGVQSGARIFRVHDVQANRQAADVAHRIVQSRG